MRRKRYVDGNRTLDRILMIAMVVFHLLLGLWYFDLLW
jgi:hypothetical protein